MALGTAAAFWAVSFLFIMTPGADWAFAISAGLRHRTIVPAVSGLLAGHVLATALVAAGIATVVASSPTVLATLTVAGACYLVFLGVGMLTGPTAAPIAGESRAGLSWSQQAATGLGVSSLNPKLMLLFLALLPQFLDTDATWPVPAQILVLGVVHLATCAIVYTLVGVCARSVLRTRPAAAKLVTRFSGAAMVVIGAVLIVEQLIA